MTLGTLSYARPQGPPPLERNCRAGLIAFGVVSMILGVASSGIALVVACFVIQEVAASVAKADIPELFLSLGTYTFFAVGFIALGTGSIRCKRWVRPIVLSFGPVIIVGSLLKFTAIVGDVLRDTELPGHHSGDLSLAAAVFGLLIATSLIYIVYYRGDAVRQTLQAYDLQLSKCEQFPLPVLATSAGLFFAGFGVVLLSTDSRSPFDIALLNGPASVMIKLIYGIILLYGAYLTLKINVKGWWVAITALSAGFVANLITRFRAAVAMDVDTSHRELIASIGISGPASATPQLPTPTFTVALTGLVCVGYLLWVRRYFRHSLPVVQ